MLDKVELKEYLENVFRKGKLKLDISIKPLMFDQRIEIRLKEDRAIYPRCFVDMNFYKKRYNSKYPEYTISFDIINKVTYKTLLVDSLRIDCNTLGELAMGIYDCLMFKKKIPVSYVAEIFKGKRNYSGCFVDFDGCVFADKDFYKCIQKAKGALALHLEGMLEDGDSLPIPKYWGRNESDKEEDEESYLVLIEMEIKLGGLKMNEFKGRVIEILSKNLFKVNCIGGDILCNLSRDILDNDKNPRILINDIVIVRFNYSLSGGRHKLLNGTIVSLPVLP